MIMKIGYESHRLRERRKAFQNLTFKWSGGTTVCPHIVVLSQVVAHRLVLLILVG